MRDAFVRRLFELARADERIMLVTGDLGFNVLDQFAREMPRQFINAGVAEQNMTGLATGLALEGRIVFTYSIANFPTLRCLEQVRNDAAYHGANVKIVAIGGGFSYGALGVSHHATEDLAILRSIPEVTVVSPGCEWEVSEATTALVETPGTCYFRLDKSSARNTSRAGERFQIGRGRVVKEGHDLAIITCGGILGVVLDAASRLGSSTSSPRVVSLHTVKPIDRDLLIELARTHAALLIVEEHILDGGLGGAIAEVLLDARVHPAGWRRLGLRGGFSSIVGSQDYLRTRYGLDADAIVAAAEELLRAQAA